MGDIAGKRCLVIPFRYLMVTLFSSPHACSYGFQLVPLIAEETRRYPPLRC